MANSLISKPSGMRYTDLCIYVDQHIYEDDPDYDLIFQYICVIVNMLAWKGKYFNKTEYYEQFSYEVATEVFFKMRDSKDSNRIKSVSNYTRSIMPFRRLRFNSENFSEVINPEYKRQFNEDAATEKLIEKYEASSKELVKCTVDSIIDGIPITVKHNIPKIYSGKSIRGKLYTSAILTLLMRFSNSDKFKTSIRYQEKKISAYDYYNMCINSTDVILWKLDNDMADVVRLIINKTLKEFKDDIGDCISDFTISRELYNELNANELEESDKFDEKID